MANRNVTVIPARTRLELPVENRPKLRVAAYARAPTAISHIMVERLQYQRAKFETLCTGGYR